MNATCYYRVKKNNGNIVPVSVQLIGCGDDIQEAISNAGVLQALFTYFGVDTNSVEFVQSCVDNAAPFGSDNARTQRVSGLFNVVTDVAEYPKKLNINLPDKSINGVIAPLSDLEASASTAFPGSIYTLLNLNIVIYY